MSAGPAPLSFVAVVYESLPRAEEALAAAEPLDPLDAAIVVRATSGKIELHQTRETSAGEGAVAGGTVGLLAGLLFGIPVGAALVGLLAGGSWGVRDTGIDNDRLRRLGEELTGRHAVLCVLVAKDVQPELARVLAPYGGEAVEADVTPP